MARRPRIHIDEVPLHIVQRGHNRQPCFFAEEDYHSYPHWLGEAMHAYALMTNHVHLLLTPKDAKAVPNLIIALGRRYVQYTTPATAGVNSAFGLPIFGAPARYGIAAANPH